MNAALVHAALAALTPISLEELTDCADLQTRIDRKYMVPMAQLPHLLAEVDRDTQVLQIRHARSFTYESVYFDTPDLTTYLLTAHRRRRRFKIRTRVYVDSGLCWLEVKTRGSRAATVKNRLPYQSCDQSNLFRGRWFVDTVLAKEGVQGSQDMVFVPTLTTRYRRSTLYLPPTCSRVTIDTDLTWEHADFRLHLPEHAIVETKSGSTASRMDRLLWESGFRPLRISKYATGLAAMRPELPANRWRRTLNRYFESRPTPILRQHQWLKAS